ncbi:MAG: hypothetical protein J0H74_10635 [Chitinophagaceae bacterium]|nr:hypothetical protein [Chitinophagaceae bacterium]
MHRHLIYLVYTLALTVTTTTAAAQDSTFQNLYFVKKEEAAVFEKADFQPGEHAFYIYRNCIYDLVLNNGKFIMVRIVDIKNDSIYYTLYNSRPTAPTDTLSLHPGDLKKIRMIGDRLMGLYKGYSLRRCTFFFENSPEQKAFPSQKDTVYSADSTRSTIYEVVPYLTAQGLDQLYQQCGITYYYRGIHPPACEDTVKKTPPVIKKGVWFTPSGANKIKGVNVGLQTMHINGKPLAINGVNLNADILSMILTIYSLFSIPSTSSLINMPDTVDRSHMQDTVTGLSLSGGGLAGDVLVKGVSINGLTCLVTEAKGLTITGIQNGADAFKGLEISGLRNRAIHGKGVQIGLLNICKHLKGIQLGLWNVNSKRKLPIINWSF